MQFCFIFLFLRICKKSISNCLFYQITIHCFKYQARKMFQPSFWVNLLLHFYLQSNTFELLSIYMSLLKSIFNLSIQLCFALLIIYTRTDPRICLVEWFGVDWLFISWKERFSLCIQLNHKAFEHLIEASVKSYTYIVIDRFTLCSYLFAYG